MPRLEWPFDRDLPVMEVTFELRDGSDTLTRVLQVDSGAVGGPHAFSLGHEDCAALALADGASVTVTDASGRTSVRQSVWVRVSMPALDLWEPVQAVAYPRAPGRCQGLVRLPFLTRLFSSWGANRSGTGNWRFHVERTEEW